MSWKECSALDVVHRALPLMRGFEKRVSLTGTEGSNPSPSSGESTANLIAPLVAVAAIAAFTSSAHSLE
jgi:hypothetical protein